jgi:hypothetical protein
MSGMNATTIAPIIKIAIIQVIHVTVPPEAPTL